MIVGVAPQMLRIHDPEPMSKGTREWKPLGWLDTALEVGRSSSVVTNFLLTFRADRPKSVFDNS